MILEKVQVGLAHGKYAEHCKVPKIVEFTLKYTTPHFQEDIQQQHQKRRPATIERGYP